MSVLIINIDVHVKDSHKFSGWNILKSQGSNFYCRKYAIGGAMVKRLTVLRGDLG
jgi:hypothetical protein